MPAAAVALPTETSPELLDFLRRLASMMAGGRNAEMLLEAATTIEALTGRATTAEELLQNLQEERAKNLELRQVAEACRVLHRSRSGQEGPWDGAATDRKPRSEGPGVTASPVWHPGFAQAGEIGGLEESADLWHAPFCLPVRARCSNSARRRLAAGPR